MIIRRSSNLWTGFSARLEWGWSWKTSKITFWAQVTDCVGGLLQPCGETFIISAPSASDFFSSSSLGFVTNIFTFPPRLLIMDTAWNKAITDLWRCCGIDCHYFREGFSCLSDDVGNCEIVDILKQHSNAHKMFPIINILQDFSFHRWSMMVKPCNWQWVGLKSKPC